MGAKETWLRSVMAGICIAVGGAVNLSVDNKVVGAALFSAGLFTICTLGYYLYTGKVCYLLDSNQKGKYLLWLGQIWAGNLIGTALVGYGLRLSSVGRKGTGFVPGKAERFAVEHLHPFGAV